MEFTGQHMQSCMGQHMEKENEWVVFTAAKVLKIFYFTEINIKIARRKTENLSQIRHKLMTFITLVSDSFFKCK